MTRLARLLPAVRAGYGMALLCAPGPVIRRCTGKPANRRTLTGARVLGARHLAQAALTARATPAVQGVGAIVDALHAASMMLLAAADAELRRAAGIDAAVASGFAAASTAARLAR
jgi:hypothetical protein